MSLNEEEKYFAFTENEGSIEAVYWCKTLEEARKRAKKRKTEFPSEAKQVYVGEVLFDPKERSQ